MAVTAAGLTVPVFAAAAADAWGKVQELRARPELRLVTTPRHASVLLVAGAIPPAHDVAVDRVHDQLPHPRATVTGADGPADDAVMALVEAHRRLVADPSTTEADRLPDREPNEWRGVGPFGQGGEGMMGGTPYGRPMAETGDDRDGLALDQLHLRLGPFLDALPAGLVLDVTLQGEVLQAVAADPPAPLQRAEDAVDDRRARLRWLAHALHVQGLDAYAARAATLAVACGDGADVGPAFGRLRRHLRRSGLFWTLRGVGPIDGHGDAADRWQAQLDLIADPALVTAAAPAPPAPAMGDLPELLIGLTMTDAVTTIVSLGPGAGTRRGVVAP